MLTEQTVFYIFAALAIISALSVVVAKNSVRAVLFLVLSFVSMSFLWMLLEAEFLAITLVLVYVGAVMVLFLFVVMMLDVELASVKQTFVRHFPLAILVSGVFLLLLVMGLGKSTAGFDFIPELIKQNAQYSNVKVLGVALYTDYLLPFIIAGVILLVAIIAAIALTFRGKQDSIAPNPSKQVQVSKRDRLKIIKMPSEAKLGNKS